MRLVKVECSGYKRFKTRQKMDLYPALVCIVGPNAAGKSSFLDLLTHFDDDRGFEAWEETRHGSGGTIRISAHYELDSADEEALAAIPEAREVRRFSIYKQRGRIRGYGIEPEPQRNLRPRHEMRERLAKLLAHRWISERNPEEDPLLAMARAARDAVAADDDDLDADAIDAIFNFGSQLGEGSGIPYQFRTIGEQLTELAVNERRANPNDAAIEILRERAPRIVKFGEQDRALNASYNLDEETNSAIHHLLEYANTSWDELRREIDSGDPRNKARWRTRANTAIASKLDPSWGQSKLDLSLDIDGRVLTLLMRMETDDYIQLDQQSDGLRQFVALMAYMALFNLGSQPIILIDEAETHLHYDAQADLVRVFEEQREAAKIVYTTHSAGCLPRDLGTGIRAVVPVIKGDGDKARKTDDSRIENHFWTQGRGFSPLLMQMGASAFAFASTQRAVICEGITDALLLPSLIRAATGAETVRYQFVPGGSEASKSEIPDLDLAGSRVVWLFDGDSGGSDHGKKTKRGGALPGQVIYLGKKGSGLGVEDLLDKDVFLQAVNDELHTVRPDMTIPATALPDKGRGKAVDDWCAANSPKAKPVELSKVAIAQRVLDRRHDVPILASRHTRLVKKLDDELHELLSKPTSHLAKTS
jgi:hypothetical protein